MQCAGPHIFLRPVQGPQLRVLFALGHKEAGGGKTQPETKLPHPKRREFKFLPDSWSFLQHCPQVAVKENAGSKPKVIVRTTRA